MRLTFSFVALCLASTSARVFAVHRNAPRVLPRDPSQTLAPPVFPDGIPRMYTCLKKDCEAICPGSFTSVEQEYNCMYCNVWVNPCMREEGKHVRDIWLLPPTAVSARSAFRIGRYPLIDADLPGFRFHGIDKYPYCVLDMCKDACPDEHLFPNQEITCRACLQRQVREGKVKTTVRCTEPRVRLVFLPPPPKM